MNLKNRHYYYYDKNNPCACLTVGWVIGPKGILRGDGNVILIWVIATQVYTFAKIQCGIHLIMYFTVSELYIDKVPIT